MLIPLDQDFEAIQGGTWDQEFDFWQDSGNSVPFDFAGNGWTIFNFSIWRRSEVVLTGEVLQTGGTVVISLTSVQTEQLPLGTYRYGLKMSNTSTPPVVEFLARGNLKIGLP